MGGVSAQANCCKRLGLSEGERPFTPDSNSIFNSLLQRLMCNVCPLRPARTERIISCTATLSIRSIFTICVARPQGVQRLGHHIAGEAAAQAAQEGEPVRLRARDRARSVAESTPWCPRRSGWPSPGATCVWPSTPAHAARAHCHMPFLHPCVRCNSCESNCGRFG